MRLSLVQSGGIMRRAIVVCLVLLAIGLGSAAKGAEVWSISAQQPCTGLTAGFAKSLADLDRLVGPQWKAAPGPVKQQGLALLFITSCPNSQITGKFSGAFSGAFLLVPVIQNAHAKKQTHAIVVVRAAGRSATSVMQLFSNHQIPVSDAHVSLDLSGAGNRHAQAVIHFAEGTLILDAQMLSPSAPYKSVNTVALRAQPAGNLFNGPETSTRYSNGKAEIRATPGTWMQDYRLGQPLFVTLDTDFTWNFAFTADPPQ